MRVRARSLQVRGWFVFRWVDRPMPGQPARLVCWLASLDIEQAWCVLRGEVGGSRFGRRTCWHVGLWGVLAQGSVAAVVAVASGLTCATALLHSPSLQVPKWSPPHSVV